MKNDIWYLSIKSADETEIIFEYYTNDIDMALFRAMELKTKYSNASWEIENIGFLWDEEEKEKATDSNAET